MQKKTLVLGASLKTDRYSNIVIHRLRSYMHPVEAIGLRIGDISDVTITTDVVLYNDIDTVTLYLNPKRQEAYYDYIVGLNPTRVIFNPGTENPKFYKLLRESNIKFEIACTLVLLSTHQY